MGNRSSMTSPVIIPATARHTATVIFMHGLGDTGHGWAAAMQAIRSPHVKYVCPTAPTIPVTLNGGMRMPAWFDLLGLDPNGPEDEAGIKTATDTVHGLIRQEEESGIMAERIVVGGFSMGGALAMYAGLRYPKKLGGVIGLSTWLPLNSKFPQAAGATKDSPFFIGHGEMDELVPLKWGQLSAQLMRTFVPRIDFKSYRNMGHSSCEQEMQDVRSFLEKVLPAQ